MQRSKIGPKRSPLGPLVATKIIPSKMKIAPPHRTVDIRQKRRLSKNTKKTEKVLKEKSGDKH